MASILRRIFGGKNTDGTWVQADSALTARILGYAGRTTDGSQIRDTVVRRYGTSIRIEKDANGSDYEVFTKSGFQARMNAGHIETVSVGLGHKISGAISTLFSETTQNFDLVSPDGADTEDASELLNEMRCDDNHIQALVQADNESIWISCSPVFIEFVDSRLRYHVIDPGNIQVLYEDHIESRQKSRPTNRLDIEDATCVVIKTGTVDEQTNSYIAILGRSMTHLNGRYVSFQSSGDGREIPNVGAKKTYDWIAPDGEIANPLTWYANDKKALDIPEYPVAVIYSGMARRDVLFPVSDSLLREALEADVAASHIRATSGENSKGTVAFYKSESGGSQPIPDNLRGNVVCENGQKLESIHHDSAAPQIAWEILQEEMVASAQGWTVPDHHITSKDHTVEAASGVALKVRAEQLAKLRERRIKENKPAVRKIFDVEKILVFLMSDADKGAVELLESCDQLWVAGEQVFPEDEEKMVSIIERFQSLGVYDAIEAIRIAYNLSDETEAIDKYEKLRERAKKYPPINIFGEEEAKDEEDEEDEDN